MGVGGRRVVIVLSVRRLFCQEQACRRRTFAEQVSGLTTRYGRRTPLLRGLLEQVAVALAGRAGARLAEHLHAPASRSTLLRLLLWPCLIPGMRPSRRGCWASMTLRYTADRSMAPC